MNQFLKWITELEYMCNSKIFNLKKQLVRHKCSHGWAQIYYLILKVQILLHALNFILFWKKNCKGEILWPSSSDASIV